MILAQPHKFAAYQAMPMLNTGVLNSFGYLLTVFAHEIPRRKCPHRDREERAQP